MATTISPYSIYGGSVKGDITEALVRRGPAQFEITVKHAVIKGTRFGDQYSSIIEASYNKDHGVIWPDKPLKFICEWCLPLLERLAPRMGFDSLTLQNLIKAPFYRFEIVKVNASKEVMIVGGDRCAYKPTEFISPLRVGDLPLECYAIPQITASQIPLNDRNPLTGIHGKVAISERQDMYFKPRELGRETEFDRELRILNDIRTKQLLQGDVKLSQLQAIVVSEGTELQCIGLLISLIPTSSLSGDLLNPVCWTNVELHEKWERQVHATMEVLHAHGIVWGDVNAGNVVIDEDSNAWVIDFGGKNNPEFVDDDKAETVEGDLQGVKRVFEWLAKRRTGVPL